MVVHQELLLSVTVEIDERDTVGAEDELVIDYLALHEGAIYGRDPVHAHSLVEALGGEDDDLLLVLLHGDHLDADISHAAEDVLRPSLARIQATLRVLEPEELSLASLGVGACSDEIFATVTI